MGDGLLDRARSTSFALLCIPAGLGLTLVAFALTQGWPVVPGSPIPGLPILHSGVSDGRIAAGASPGGESRLGSGPSVSPATRARPGGALVAGSNRHRRLGSKGSLVSPSVPAGTGGHHASQHRSPEAQTAQPPVSTPEASPTAPPTPVAAPAQSTGAAASHGNGSRTTSRTPEQSHGVVASKNAGKGSQGSGHVVHGNSGSAGANAHGNSSHESAPPSGSPSHGAESDAQTTPPVPAPPTPSGHSGSNQAEQVPTPAEEHGLGHGYGHEHERSR
jgi:hypothetical protein